MTISGRFRDCSWSATDEYGSDPVCGWVLTALPADDRQVVAIRSEAKALLLLAQTLELHGELTLADLVVGEDLEVARKAELLTHPDEPLRWVVLVPFDRVPVVHGELVVEVVVALADRDQRGNEVVTRSVLVVEWCLAEPVRKRVHAECRLPED